MNNTTVSLDQVVQVLKHFFFIVVRYDIVLKLFLVKTVCNYNNMFIRIC